ncbi:unnamed protein product (macronuclear) [Paramecium tetraurelia]|uniref:Uncharacterized protein n=1 Tax=Paramecium tetraurelia TaxID=5888 RepID=A0CK16_PARTE|nr:uncharacterized protein GSPATT00000845001 [Paramecium tetraurelia]CAK71133.1 unnamed protein product [Paramecium tetraurelia]|eukprot:XP_001438530.1 hypothetical protein (macronuclear) [Paramecium tetraurelia strain d4-2]
MKIFQILNLLSYVLCATFSSSSIGDALHENGSIYGWREEEQKQFKNWVQENQKTYNNEFEMIYRMEVFVKNYRTMKHHNEQLPKDVWGLNIFSDETSEELMDKIFMKKDFDEHYEIFNEDDINAIKSDSLSHNSFLQADKTVKVVKKVVKKASATTKTEKATPKNPPSLDWLKQVTEVQQQGRCGSCWAFAVQDVVISRLAIANKNKLDQLSKTHLIDCADGNTEGCDGGSVSDAFDFINKYGTVYEKDYREYDQKEGQCSKPKGSIGYKQFKSVVGLTKFTNNDIETAMQTGPVTALMYADESWLRYTSGIINTCGYPKVSNYQHVVSFIAYDTQTWFAKNSWGSKWGMSGYFQIQKNGDAKCLDKIKKITYPII